jgi:hypothetical protein
MDIKDQTGGADRQRGAMHNRQRLKNWALALLLVGLAVLFYFITIVRFGHHG